MAVVSVGMNEWSLRFYHDVFGSKRERSSPVCKETTLLVCP